MVESDVKWEDGKIVCVLPITLPTSHIRVKRNDEPVAVRKYKIEEGDVLEWQISYYKEGRGLIEAGKMLMIAYAHRLINKNQLTELIDYINNVPILFEEGFKIFKRKTVEKFLGEFEVMYREVPIIHKNLDNGCFLEAELKHKQKAVGYQPMLYVFIPVKNVISTSLTNSIVGRKAMKKEVVKWYPTSRDVIEIIKTFGILSKKHNRDILRIIKQIEKDLG